MQNNGHPLVSVGCIAFNQVRYIHAALEGILAQKTSFPFEVIVHDDASTDGTAVIVGEYALKYPGRIVSVLQSENQYSQGIKIVPNTIFPRSRGKYIALCEGDDYWTDPFKLQKQADFLSSHPEHAICFHPVQVIDETGKNATHVFPPESRRGEFDFLNLLKGNFIQTCSVMFRRYDDFVFPSWFSALRLGDWPLFLLLADRGRIGFIDEVMAVYRIHQGGAWGNKPRSEVLPAVIDMYRCVDRHFSGRYRAQIREITSSLHYDLGNLQLQEKQRRLALGSAWRSLRSCRSRAVNPWKYRSFLLAKTLLPGKRRRNRPQNDPNEK